MGECLQPKFYIILVIFEFLKELAILPCNEGNENKFWENHWNEDKVLTWNSMKLVSLDS